MSAKRQDGTMTDASRLALEHLRDASQFQWYVIPMFAFVVYIYAVEIERRSWSLVLAGLTVSAIDWCLEIVNALVLHGTGTSAVWTEVGPTALQIFVGLNIETFFMFAAMGIVFGKMLPRDRAMRILGVPNRWFLVLANSIFCVFIEVLLNRGGYLVWHYAWWSLPNVALVVIFGYAPYFIATYYVMDVESMRRKIAVPAVLWGVNVLATAIFVGIGWI